MRHFALVGTGALALTACVISTVGDTGSEVRPGAYRAEATGATYHFQADGTYSSEWRDDTLDRQERGFWRYTYLNPDDRYLTTIRTTAEGDPAGRYDTLTYRIVDSGPDFFALDTSRPGDGPGLWVLFGAFSGRNCAIFRRL